jgi:prepilin-type N-terminal cleavage/methylation domain-containing protein/prepilin-type processing-associated H-X9-DG protein
MANPSVLMPIRSRGKDGFTLLELMIVVGIIAVVITWLLPAVQAAREAARRMQCASNLMQLGIGMPSYSSTHTVFPPGVVNDTGPIKNLPSGYYHSWVVQILPFIDQVNTYNHVDLGTSVYDAANDTVSRTMLALLVCPSDPGRLWLPISYAGCQGDTNTPIDSSDQGVLYLNSRVRHREITDGLAQTFLLGEVLRGASMGWVSGARSTLRNTGAPMGNHIRGVDPVFLASPDLQKLFAATTPRDELFEVVAALTQDGSWPVDLPGGFASYHATDCNFLFCDGSVRPVSRMVDVGIYRLLGHRADGEALSSDSY